MRKDYEEDPDLSHSFDNIKKTIDLKKVGKFVNDVLSGKINNKYDAEDEHNKNIKNDNDYLGNVNIRTEDRKETKRII